MSDKKHHHHSEDTVPIEVHWKDRTIRYGRKWYDLHEEFDRFGDGREFFRRVHDDGTFTVVGDKQLKRELWHIWHKEEKRREKKREATRREEKAEKLRESDSASESASASESDGEGDSAEAKDGEIRRDKHGVRVESRKTGNTTYWFTTCVNNSTKWRGDFSVRLFVRGKSSLFTLGKREMRALLREYARAFSPKELREVLLTDLKGRI